MTLIRLQDCPPSPWKNGRGSTRQLLISPAGAGLDDFDYRVSLASVASDGPFSRFDGVDRQLLILQGAGLELKLDGRDSLRLTPGDAPLAFAGETPAQSRLLDGPLTDFNVMTRRGRYQSRLDYLTVDDALELRADAELILLLALEDGAQILQNGHLMPLAAWDAAVARRGETLRLHAARPLALLQVELEAIAPS
ncbi:HutD family protein [Chromobacterium haemolyticum]|uniref:HutD/Ves family protein n=1 Tax=Chromobacterium haemolyticum TaxID=394935 RepID=UPI000DEEB1A8|nr:HutD family protein [Chromobacterium haemolyticum]